MRRLPVYLLVDVSGSMAGEPIEAVKNGIQSLISSLRQDPQALENAFISVITFSDSFQQAVPLTDLPQFQMPQFSACGGTALGGALKFLKDCADKEIVKTTPEMKGDWKPLVFILTDGQSGDVDGGVVEFQKRKWGIVVACAAGSGANPDELKKITECVIQLDVADSASFKSFFKWVSSSISVSSKSVGTGGKEVQGLDQLPPPPAEIIVV